MDLLTAHNTMIRDHARKVAEWEDATVYAYIVAMITELRNRGENPLHYELIFVDGGIETTETGAKINKILKVRKIEK